MHILTIEGPVYCCSVESFLSGADIDIGVELDVSSLLLKSYES